MKKLKNALLSLKFIFKPSYWMMNYPYSKAWDDELNRLIDNYYFENIGLYTADICGLNVWVENHHNASFRINATCTNVRPSRLTIERAHIHLIKSIMKNNESKSRN